MHVKTRVTVHPRTDVGVFVSAVVVRDHVDFQVLGGLASQSKGKVQGELLSWVRVPYRLLGEAGEGIGSTGGIL